MKMLVSAALISIVFSVSAAPLRPVRAVKPIHVDSAKVDKQLSEAQKKSIRDHYVKSSSSDLDLAVKLFRLDLAPYVKTMDREIITYNYRKESEFSDGKQITDRSLDTQAAVDYANKWGQAAKKRLPNESGFYGWGLYTSRDPSASEGYGVGWGVSSTFNMVTVKFDKNDKMLDIRKFGSALPMSQETAEAIKKVCPTFRGGYGGTVGKGAFIQDQKCHDIYIKALDSFDIQAVIYDWSSTTSSLCPGKSDSGAAFVIINQKLDAKSLDYFTKLPDSVMAEAKAIQAETNLQKREAAKKKFSLGITTFNAYEKMAAIKASFDSVSQTSEAYSAFMNPDQKVNDAYIKEFTEHNFDCTSAHDDKPTYKPEQVWEVMLEDSKLIQTLDKGLKTILENCQE